MKSRGEWALILSVGCLWAWVLFYGNPMLDRLDALGAEMETATKILAIMSGYESFGPDEDTTGYDWKNRPSIPMSVIIDSLTAETIKDSIRNSLPPDPDTMPAIDSGDSIMPIYRFPRNVIPLLPLRDQGGGDR